MTNAVQFDISINSSDLKATKKLKKNEKDKLKQILRSNVNETRKK